MNQTKNYNGIWISLIFHRPRNYGLSIFICTQFKNFSVIHIYKLNGYKYIHTTFICSFP